MLKEKYDMVVVGAGPAGLMTAKTAAQEGLSVLIMDMKRDIPKIDRSCCTMLINEPSTHGDTCTIVNNNTIHYEKLGLDVKYTGQWARLEQSIRITPGGKKLIMSNPNGVSIAYNKEVLLRGILEDCEKLGVDVLTETFGLRAENTKKDEVKVLFRGSRSRTVSSVKGRIAVAADGVNSQISMGLESFKKRKFFVTFRVASYFLEGVKSPFPPAFIIFVGRGHTPDGNGAIYMLDKHLADAKPGDKPIIDLMYATPVINSSNKMGLDNFLKNGKFKHWFEGAKVVHTAAATLNFYTCMLEPFEGNIIAVGDAPSFIETYCQGAMMYGYKAGKVAAEHLRTGCGYGEYGEYWRKTFEYCWPGEIEKALRGYGIGFLNDEELDYLFGLTDKEMYDGYVSENTAPAVMKDAFMSKMDRIKKERPEIAEKFLKFHQSDAHEVLEKTK